MSGESSYAMAVAFERRQVKSGLEWLGEQILAVNKANGWNVTTPEQFQGDFQAGDEYTLPACIASIHGDLSMALEMYRKRDGINYLAALGQAAKSLKLLRGKPGVFGPAPEMLWMPNAKIPAVIALIHSEASEALEAFNHEDEHNFAEEMADVVIRVLDCTAGLGIDLGAAILAKLEKNRTRGFRHGGKAV